MPARGWAFAAWPRAGLTGNAVTAGTALVVEAGAGRPGNASRVVLIREKRFVMPGGSAAPGARLLVAVSAAFVVAAAALVAARAGGACVAAIGTSSRNRRAGAVFTV